MLVGAFHQGRALLRISVIVKYSLYNRHATVESVETPGLKRDVEIRRTAMLDLTPPEINRVVDTLKVAIWRVDIFWKTTNIF